MATLSYAGYFSFGLPTLQCLLQLCDIRYLSNEVVKEFAMCDANFGYLLSSKSNKRRARARIVSSIQTMRQMDVQTCMASGWSFAPAESFVVTGSRPRIAQHMLMLLVRRQEDDEDCCDDADSKSGPETPSHIECLRDYGAMPWEDLLGIGVNWTGSWTCCDRYRALAACVWEMTRYGFERDDARLSNVPWPPQIAREKENSSAEEGAEESKQVLHELIEVQSTLLASGDYRGEYAQRISRLASDMNNQAQRELEARMRCA